MNFSISEIKNNKRIKIYPVSSKSYKCDECSNLGTHWLYISNIKSELNFSSEQIICNEHVKKAIVVFELK